MAQGIELILGFERKDRDVLAKALGLTLDEEGELHGAVVAVRRACDRAHSAAIVAMVRLMMDVARTAIEAELPIFKQAVWMVRERFY